MLNRGVNLDQTRQGLANQVLCQRVQASRCENEGGAEKVLLLVLWGPGRDAALRADDRESVIERLYRASRVFENHSSIRCFGTLGLGGRLHGCASSHGPPNGLELTGDGGAADGVRCSDVLGAARIVKTFSRCSFIRLDVQRLNRRPA